MDLSLDMLRRRAKSLRKGWTAGEPHARHRVHTILPKLDRPPKHADFLHVIAREANFESWPRLKLAAETRGLDRAARAQRLKIALAHGQTHVVHHLLEEAPDLPEGLPEAEIALYRRASVAAWLQADPGRATARLGRRAPLHVLAMSQWFKARPDLRADMLAIAALLVEAGADVNAGLPAEPGSAHMLSPLYLALGHAGNMVLAEWLLAHGADPNDDESLYHSTELGHRDGLKLLLRHGARVAGTNALPRALDFNDHAAVELLLHAGADPNEGVGPHPSGQPALVIPALPQAARRMCDARMIRLLLDHGADPEARWQGLRAYALARVYGNAEAARLLAEAGADTALTAEEQLLAAAAEGAEMREARLDPARLPEEYRDLPRNLLHLPGKLDHVRRLIALGLEPDRPDAMGLTPVQIAGWEGLPEAMGYFLGLGPRLDHVNGYGGTLLSTIIHGSENCPARATRDHLACLQLALEAGVPLPDRAIDLAGVPEVAEALADWAADHPDQVVEGGVG
jgi:ankyrin repeat protein